MSLKKFLTKHAGELGKVAGVLGAIVGALPIDRQDKRNLGNAVDDLLGAASSIANSAKKMSDDGLSLDNDAVKSALRELLPEIAEAVFKLAETKAARESAKDKPGRAVERADDAAAVAADAGAPREPGAASTAPKAKARRQRRPK